MKSKWFVVATEGATTDGREIKRKWIEQMAKNYNPKVFGARINLEHIKFSYYDPQSPHSQRYGDVLALKTKSTQQGKLQLLAQIDPTDELKELNKKRQKIYASAEIDPSFAGTGEAYLVGLAVTDNPASLGCEILSFAAKAEHNPFHSRKSNPDTLFSEAIEVNLEQELESEGTKESNFIAKIKKYFAAELNETSDDISKSQEPSGNDQKTLVPAQEQHYQSSINIKEDIDRLNKKIDDVTEAMRAFEKEYTSSKKEMARLTSTLDVLVNLAKEHEPTPIKHTGEGQSIYLTDC